MTADPFATARRRAEKRPWPAAPLAALVDGMTLGEIRDTFRCGYPAWSLALEAGLTDDQADRWSVALGHHPSHLWPDWFDYGLTERDDRHVNGPGLGWRQAWEWAETRRAEPAALPSRDPEPVELGEAA